MKKILLATSALVATAGIASAQGVAVTGTASMGILGGDWVDDNDNDTGHELHTDIDVHFTMTGQTDTGLTFGASIDLDESDGEEREGASAAFDNRAQGGEEIFISGAFGTLTMGDTDGALDWALQEIDIGGTLGDAHTKHAGYSGNDFADDYSGGQIVRYDHSFGDFAVALSANISDDATDEDVIAFGAKHNVSLPSMELGIGVGYSQLGHDGHGREEDDAMGVSLNANFNNGFRAILNWVDMGDSNEYNSDGFGEQYIGAGIGYIVDDWTLAANWGKYSEEHSDLAIDRGQSGYAVVVNYDLGGGAEVQLGYAKSDCDVLAVGPVNHVNLGVDLLGDCPPDVFDSPEYISRLSLGMKMNF